MRNRFYWLVIVVLVLWMAKLNYDLLGLDQRFSSTEQLLSQSEQQNASLNDQIVALQRQQGTTASEPFLQASPDISTEMLDPIAVIRQQVSFIQFALQQRQYVYVIDQLNQLDQRLSSYPIAPALANSIHKGLLQDKQMIQQVMILNQQQQQVFDDLIQKIDEQLHQAQQDNRLSLERKSNLHFWQGWLKLERAQHEPSDLMNRRILLKEVQLRLLLARQALNDGHASEFQHLLNLAISSLSSMPDAVSQKLAEQLKQLKQLPVLVPPKLKTMDLLG